MRPPGTPAALWVLNAYAVVLTALLVSAGRTGPGRAHPARSGS
ncbi:hypothetical protein [Nonomuraea cavernae]